MQFIEKEQGKVIKSTVEIPVGTEIMAENGTTFRVREVLTSGLLVESTGKKQEMNSTTFTFQRKEGSYIFQTKLRHQEGDLVLKHSVLVQREQRRKHVRSAIEIPVNLNGYLTSSIDLSGGGCMVRIEGSRAGFEEGRDVELLFFIDTHKKIKARGKIIFTGKLFCRIRFTVIDERDRDELIKFQFQTDMQQRTGTQ